MIKLNFSHFVTVALLALAGVYHSAAFAFASVISLGLIVGKEALDVYRDSRKAEVKPGVPDEMRKALQELQARLTSIEYREKTRGF